MTTSTSSVRSNLGLYEAGWYKNGVHLGLPSLAEASFQPMTLQPTTRTLPASCQTPIAYPLRAWPSLRLTREQRKLNKYWLSSAAWRKRNLPRTQWQWKDPEPRSISGLWDNLPMEIQPPIDSSSQNDGVRPKPALTDFQFKDYLKRSRMAFEQKYNEMPEETLDQCQVKAMIYQELDLKFHGVKHLYQEFAEVGLIDFSVPYWGEDIKDPKTKTRANDDNDEETEEDQDTGSRGRGDDKDSSGKGSKRKRNDDDEQDNSKKNKTNIGRKILQSKGQHSSGNNASIISPSECLSSPFATRTSDIKAVRYILDFGKRFRELAAMARSLREDSQSSR